MSKYLIFQVRGPEHEHVYKKLVEMLELIYAGAQPQYPACPPPCIVTRYSSKFIEKMPHADNNTRKMDLVIDPIIDVITYHTAYGLSAFLAEIGGSLGLWLGISLVGILEILHVGWKKLKNLSQM